MIGQLKSKALLFAGITLILCNNIYCEEVTVGSYSEDVDYMMEKMERIHPNLYHNTSKEEVAELVSTIKADNYESVDEFYAALKVIFDTLDDSHTEIFPVTKSIKAPGNNTVRENKFHIVDGIGFLTIDTFDGNKEEFTEFINFSMARLNEEKVENLVIDMRGNTGGMAELGEYLIEAIWPGQYRQNGEFRYRITEEIITYMNSNGWMSDQDAADLLENEGSFFLMKDGPEYRKHLEEPLYNGRTYLLIGPVTFSSGVIFSAIYKDYNIGMILGKETGGLASDYTCSYHFELPFSKLKASVSWQYLARPNGEDTGMGVLPDIDTDSPLHSVIALIQKN